MNFRQNLRKIKLLKVMASLYWTVACLILLFILTLWGTIAQVQSGLYLAQERYFESFYFLIFGFIPFPGAQLVMWVLFFNVVSAALIRFVYSWKRVGILIIHGGLILFLVSGYILLHCSEDSHLTLKEGESSNVSTAFHTWEIAVWEEGEETQTNTIERDITSVDIAKIIKDSPVVFGRHGISLRLKDYCRNCTAYHLKGAAKRIINASGINKLEPVSLEVEPEKNTPGAIFEVSTSSTKPFDILLYGEESLPTQITIGDKKFNIILRLKHYPLPFTLKLMDFIMDKHPGTDTARSFKSQVVINPNEAWREKLISMNNPLRYKNYTFYQSSYSISDRGSESSTLAVVKNKGRVMPYISTFVTVFGLIVHFIMVALNTKKPRNSPEKNNA